MLALGQRWCRLRLAGRLARPQAGSGEEGARSAPAPDDGTAACAHESCVESLRAHAMPMCRCSTTWRTQTR